MRPQSGSEDESKPKGYKALSTIEATKSHIDKLMARIDKPVVIPERKEKELKAPKDFVRNVQGSSAGAGSGEFHVYRALRRKEYARLNLLESKQREEIENVEYQKHLEELKRLDEERTAKRREKRRKRGKGKGGKKEEVEDKSDDDSDNEEEKKRPLKMVRNEFVHGESRVEESVEVTSNAEVEKEVPSSTKTMTTPINQNKPPINLLIGATGSVASLKIPLLVQLLQSAFHSEINIKVIPTQKALHFFDPKELPTEVELLTDEDEWKIWEKKGDPVLHIKLRDWADAILIAPLDANTLAKLANGLCDNLLNPKPVVICPAMNTHMYTHPFTSKHLRILKEELGYLVIDPVEKLLACGDIGVGGMAEVPTIVSFIQKMLQR
ncbi:hypothetical protein HDV05_003795 [Chytridiales sp. JEL 0842]|nr:hypothetical protein HDV05_003795 [Chytridiales sp. JEL 0842]